VPYAYFGLAIFPLFCFDSHAMFYCVLALEIPAIKKGAVSLECPREVYNLLSWPDFESALPPDWTIFLPVNSRYAPLHDREVENEEDNDDDDVDDVDVDEQEDLVLEED